MLRPHDWVSLTYHVNGRPDTIHGLVLRVLSIDGSNVLVWCPDYTDDPLHAQSVVRRDRLESQPAWWCWFRADELTVLPEHAAA